jgi:hypothetical protein
MEKGRKMSDIQTLAPEHRMGLGHDEAAYLQYLLGKVREAEEQYGNPEISKRFGVKLERGELPLPPEKVRVGHSRVIDRKHIHFFGETCECCVWDSRGRCMEYCCDGPFEHHRLLTFAAIGGVAFLGGYLLGKRA